MENINIAELLKNCPKGMKLDCTIFENLEFDHINKNDEPYPIICRVKTEWGYYNTHSFTEYGCYSVEEYSKCVIFPKGKTTWEGFHRPFKDGDIVAGKNYACSYITIFRKFINDDSFSQYVCLTSFGDFKVGDISDNANLRLATKEEKQKLFDAIKDNGYKWNPENKTLEKLIKPKFKVGDRVKHKDGKEKNGIEYGKILSISDDTYDIAVTNDMGIFVPIADQDDWELDHNKFDISTLKPFESKVLIRGGEDCFWKPAIYGFSHSKGCYVVGGIYWEQCIPYEANKELLGTTNNPKEHGSN